VPELTAGDRAATTLVAVVRMLLDGNVLPAERVLQSLDRETGYQVLRGLTRILAEALPGGWYPTDLSQWPEAAEGQAILQQQLAGDVEGAEFGTYLLVQSDDPTPMVGASSFLAIGVATLVQQGLLEWPDVHYQLADWN
jgi:hypothetical protein